jgi:hypothetical protein
MQQATSSIGNVVSTAPASKLPKAVAPTRFVVNLCASTTPVGLVQPSHAGLKRYTFFVSRRLEEGRERFRLHMGYFDSQEEAEKILDLVRDVYPAAWAGVAPGIKLRARAALPESSPVDEPLAAPVAVASLSPPAAAAVPVDTAAAKGPAATTAAPTAMAAVTQLTLELAPDLPRAKLIVDVATEAAAHDAKRSLNDVRATIASLSDADAPAAPAAPAAPVLEGAAVLRLLTSARPPPAARLAPIRPAASRNVATPAPAVNAPTVKAAAPEAPAQPEQAVFAVQLLWSVQPIDMSKVPQLAIFSAYTLYGAEGNRGGRRWYGLRLGFFTDSVSAKQVAQYVRSEFTSVSVVPVTERERGRAGAATAKPLPAVAPPKIDGPELNFINEVSSDTATSGSQPALEAAEPAPKSPPTLRPAVVAALGMTNRATPGKRAKLRNAPGGKPMAKRPAPARQLSLEETLEILGAGELQMETARRSELLSESAVRERKPAAANGSRFARLMNRLAERLGNS